MKRLPAILFFAILLFNFYGYRLMIDCLQDKQQAAFTAQVDRNNYKESDLISIKTAMDVPYYTNTQVYERTYGSVKVGGVEYEYVKRRVYHDTLELLCLPNGAKTAMEQTRNEFFKNSIDGGPFSPNKKSSHTAKISLPDFCQELKTYGIASAETQTGQAFTRHTDFLSFDYILRQERPPQVCAASNFGI